MSGTDQNHAVVVGAGLTGLVTGYYIATSGLPVTVYETEDGFAAAEGLISVGGALVEREFEPVIKGDDQLFQLLDLLDAGSLLEWLPSRYGVFIDGRTVPFERPRSLMGFKSLGYFQRLRLKRQFTRLLKAGMTGVSEDQSAERWLEKQFGKESVAALWRPVLHGYWGKRASRVSAAWLARQLSRITESWTGGKGGAAFLSASTRVLADRLQRGIEQHGGRVLHGKAVQEVLTSSKGLMGVFIDGQVVDCGVVVLCQRPDSIRALCPGLPESFFERLEVIPFLSVIRLTLELDRPFGEQHHLLVCDESLPFSELVEHTRWVGSEAYGDRHILHLTAGHNSGDPQLKDPKEKIVDLYLEGLQRINPSFDRHWVTAHHFQREVRCCPVPVAGSPLSAPVSTTPVPGIYLAAEAAHGRRYRGPAASAAIGREIARLLSVSRSEQ